MRSPWTWPSGYEFHAHADLPVLLNTQNLQSIVQVRNTANRSPTRCNAGLRMQQMHWYTQTLTPAMHWTTCSSIHANPTHWIDQSHKTTGTGDSTRSKEAASMLVHVVARRSLAHRVARNAHWMLGRSGQCCSTALVTQLHPGRGAVRGSVTSLINTAKCRSHSSSDANTRCHADLS